MRSRSCGSRCLPGAAMGRSSTVTKRGRSRPGFGGSGKAGAAGCDQRQAAGREESQLPSGSPSLHARHHRPAETNPAAVYGGPARGEKRAVTRGYEQGAPSGTAGRPWDHLALRI